MASFGGAQITNIGRALQAKVQDGEPLVFTRIRIGSGQLGGQQIADLTNLIAPQMWLTINKSQTQPGGRHVVGAPLNNADVTTGFYFREIGVFALDPVQGEILYCYANAAAGAEYIPAGDGPDIVEKQIDIVTLVGSAPNVSAKLDEALVLVTSATFNSHKNAAVLDHLDGSVTDAKIGERTVDDTQAASGGAAPLTKVLSMLANMIKRITGKASWWTAPRTTLENAVKLNGDTMTGNLTIKNAYPVMHIWSTDGTEKGVALIADNNRLYFESRNSDGSSANSHNYIDLITGQFVSSSPNGIIAVGAIATQNGIMIYGTSPTASDNWHTVNDGTGATRARRTFSGNYGGGSLRHELFSDGVMSVPYQSNVFVSAWNRVGGGQNIPALAYTKVEMPNIHANTQGEWDTTTSTFTPKHAGYYHFDAMVEFMTNTTTTNRQRLRVADVLVDIKMGTGSGYHALSGGITVYLNAGVTVSVEVYSDQAASLTASTNTHVSIAKVA